MFQDIKPAHIPLFDVVRDYGLSKILLSSNNIIVVIHGLYSFSIPIINNII